MLVLRTSQLGAIKKCTSRLEGNHEDSNCTNLNCVSNNKHKGSFINDVNERQLGGKAKCDTRA